MCLSIYQSKYQFAYLSIYLGYRFDDPWATNTRSRKDAHLLRLWAEVFHVTTGQRQAQIIELLSSLFDCTVWQNPVY